MLNSSLWPTVDLVRPPCKKIHGLTSALQASGERPNRDTTNVEPFTSIPRSLTIWNALITNFKWQTQQYWAIAKKADCSMAEESPRSQNNRNHGFTHMHADQASNNLSQLCTEIRRTQVNAQKSFIRVHQCASVFPNSFQLTAPSTNLHISKLSALPCPQIAARFRSG